jgi:hypothetical protein
VSGPLPGSGKRVMILRAVAVHKWASMKPKIALLAACLALVPAAAAAQDSFSRNFKAFKNLIPGIDFYARGKADVEPFGKPLADAGDRLRTFLGPELPKGAIVICSSMEQRDSVSEVRVLRMGYQWVLVQLTQEATNQQMLAQLQARMGGEVPAALLERFKNPSPEMRAAATARLVSSTVQRASLALVMKTTAPEKEFRASRLDDTGRSPLSDWLDVGLSNYAAGTSMSSLRMLQDRIDEAFPLEDVLTMYRPFVAPDTGGGGGNFRIMMGGPGGGQSGGASGGSQGGARPSGDVQVSPMGSGSQGGGNRSGGGQRGMSVPKEVQDRMTFDAQASTLFAYMVGKFGKERVAAIVKAEREGKGSRDLITAPDMLGPDLEKAEIALVEWLKTQKPEPGPGPMRIMMGGPGGSQQE